MHTFAKLIKKRENGGALAFPRKGDARGSETELEARFVPLIQLDTYRR